MDKVEKRASYEAVLAEMEAVLEGIADDVTAMATCACLLHSRFSYSSWTGFYRVVAPRLLRVGPYQGSLGCLEISFDRGVCGAAATTRTAQLVEDVTAFPGHIACDASARSEVVVPVFNAAGDLVAVLDVDSHQPAAFDEEDRDGLERIAGRLAAFLGPGRDA